MASGGPSGRTPTSKEVAERAGVSRATVSFVINATPGARISEETRRRVLEAVHELGYAPNASARSLRAGRTGLVVLPLPTLPFGPIYDRVVERVQAELRARDRTLLIHGDREAAGLSGARKWLELRPDAVLVEGHRCGPEAQDLLSEAGVRVVLLGTETTSETVAVAPNSWGAGDCAGRYLLERGHRSVGAVLPQGALAELGRQRAEGVCQVVEAAGGVVEPLPMQADAEGADEVVRRLRESSNAPSAVFGYNDEHAALLLRALRLAGVDVPREMAVIGVDDLLLASLVQPTLTSVNLEEELLTVRACENLVALLDGVPGEADEAPSPTVTVRESA